MNGHTLWQRSFEFPFFKKFQNWFLRKLFSCRNSLFPFLSLKYWFLRSLFGKVEITLSFNKRWKAFFSNADQRVGWARHHQSNRRRVPSFHYFPIVTIVIIFKSFHYFPIVTIVTIFKSFPHCHHFEIIPPIANSASELLYLQIPLSQLWHPNFSPLYDILNLTTHIFSESLWHVLFTDAPVMTMKKTQANTKTKTKTMTKTKWLKDL